MVATPESLVPARHKYPESRQAIMMLILMAWRVLKRLTDSHRGTHILFPPKERWRPPSRGECQFASTPHNPIVVPTLVRRGT